MEKIYVVKDRYTGKPIFAMKCTSFRLCVEIAASLKKDISGADLRLTNLRGAYLSGADLSGADLSGADLSGADLSLTNLSGADLRGVNLSLTNLSEADLSGSDLDFSCIPLWCGSLKAKFDERLVYQLLYHVLSIVKNSNNVSKELRTALLTVDNVELANKFHRIPEVPKL